MGRHEAIANILMYLERSTGLPSEAYAVLFATIFIFGIVFLANRPQKQA